MYTHTPFIHTLTLTLILTHTLTLTFTLTLTLTLILLYNSAFIVQYQFDCTITDDVPDITTVAYQYGRQKGWSHEKAKTSTYTENEALCVEIFTSKADSEKDENKNDENEDDPDLEVDNVNEFTVVSFPKSPHTNITPPTKQALSAVLPPLPMSAHNPTFTQTHFNFQTPVRSPRIATPPTPTESLIEFDKIYSLNSGFDSEEDLNPAGEYILNNLTCY